MCAARRAETRQRDETGKVVHPPLTGEMSQREVAFLERTRPIWEGGLLTTVALKGALEGTSIGPERGWMSFFHGGGQHFLWWRTDARRVIALEVSGIDLMTELVTQLPDTPLEADASPGGTGANGLARTAARDDPDQTERTVLAETARENATVVVNHSRCCVLAGGKRHHIATRIEHGHKHSAVDRVARAELTVLVPTGAKQLPALGLRERVIATARHRSEPRRTVRQRHTRGHERVARVAERRGAIRRAAPREERAIAKQNRRVMRPRTHRTDTTMLGDHCVQ